MVLVVVSFLLRRRTLSPLHVPVLRLLSRSHLLKLGLLELSLRNLACPLCH